jgi:cholesterol oxidase
VTYLATPVERLVRDYDVVVVGSGYGGAVSASRLARAGFRVCVLERGEERQPGDFPESPISGLREIQVDFPDRRFGGRSALFDFRVNPDISVLQGCGLGGTSLINANVAIMPDERVWLDPIWPEAIRADLETRIADGQARAVEMLRPNPFPGQMETPTKLQALERSAQFMGRPFVRAPIVVNFEGGVNHVGVEQPACNGCGNCVGGCNRGSKNTLLANYLPDAVNHGAQLFTGTAVRRVERQGKRWLVHFDLVDSGAARMGAPSMFVRAETVIIAAGSLGSTEILLRSREAGLATSDRLGHGFTGNGDVLGFAYNADISIHGVAVPSGRPGFGPGPCISGIIDLRQTDQLADGMIIEEGAIPSSLAPMLGTSLFLAARLLGKDTDQGFQDFAAETFREVQSLVPGLSGAVGNTQTFLVMAHDDSQGQIRLVDDRVRIHWDGCGGQPVFDRINANLLRATEALGGTYIKNPIWAERLGKSLITVHPLGGCGMGETAESGAVDHLGRVFAGRSGPAVHPGLYVSDGSVLPRSLGVNPLLTISTLAERAVALMVEQAGRTIAYDLPSKPPARASAPRVGIQFSETMRGHFSLDPEMDYTRAAQAGEAAGRTLEFTVTVVADDLDEMVRSRSHQARLYGTVRAPALAAEAMTVTSGTFQLLTEDTADARARRMTYEMPIETREGQRYHLSGFKHIRDDEGFDLWSDTTTLFVTLRQETDQGPVAGRGVLVIRPADFARQLATFKVTNAGSIAGRLKAAAAFGRFFAGSLYDTYGGVLARRSVLDPDAAPRTLRELRTEPPETFFFNAPDGVALRMLRYRGGDRGAVLLVPGVGMSGRIFSVDTTDTTLVEYLAEAGYDVWVLDHRASVDLPASAGNTTVDQIATGDLPAAVAKLREVSGAEAVDVVGQGVGAVTLMMSLIQGLSGVRSAVCLQAGLHLKAPRTARFKAGLHLPEVLSALGKRSLTARAGGAGWTSKLLDFGLRAVPVDFHETCRSPVCRRITFMYGHLYHHDQLNRATHDALHELFGVASLSMFDHLAQMVRAGHAVTADGASCLHHLDRLALPITFIHGAENACFLPEGTSQTMAELAAVNGPDWYRRKVVARYGDIDCLIGKDAARDVFPLILEHLVAVARSRSS